VTWDARFTSPKSNIRHPRGQPPQLKCEWHTTKPDKDNLEKAILDELKQAGFFRDDAQVCSGGPNTKRYVLPGVSSDPEGLPGVTIEVEELEP
jgi:Holliday junction resolvase RusA-like endonuclease